MAASDPCPAPAVAYRNLTGPVKDKVDSYVSYFGKEFTQSPDFVQSVSVSAFVPPAENVAPPRPAVADPDFISPCARAPLLQRAPQSCWADDIKVRRASPGKRVPAPLRAPTHGPKRRHARYYPECFAEGGARRLQRLAFHVRASRRCAPAAHALTRPAQEQPLRPQHGPRRDSGVGERQGRGVGSGRVRQVRVACQLHARGLALTPRVPSSTLGFRGSNAHMFPKVRPAPSSLRPPAVGPHTCPLARPWPSACSSTSPATCTSRCTP